MNWIEVPLTELLLDARNGTWGSPPKGDGKDLPVLRSTNIHNANLVFNDVALRAVSESSKEKYKLLDGDIIVTTSSGSEHLIGKNALFKQPNDDRTYLFSNFTLRLRLKKNLIVPRFLHLYLNSSKAKAELLSIQRTTSGLRNLNIPLYLSQKVPVPPLSEQRRIVEILDQADELRKKRVEADAKVACILPALFYKMFGDPATNLKNLRKVPIKDIVARIDRRNPAENPNEYFTYIDIAGVNGEIGAIIETKHLVGSNAPSRARQIVKAKDVIISTVRPYLRATALIPNELDDQICSTGFCVLRSKNGLGYGFLYALSRLPWFTEQLNMRARGASYPAVTDADILSLEIPYTFDKTQLKTFDHWVDEILNCQRSRSRLKDKLEDLFLNILHNAFVGDLTSKWRERHMKELLEEMEQEAKALNISIPEVS